jgi:NAD(P)-dependent dehydrogenase (short-subunit alcohol dehydrogenase family)
LATGAIADIHILLKAPSQKGKIAIVTGANIGLGYETALGFAKLGAKVILACRNHEKAEEAKRAILRKVPEADLDILLIDLKSLGSVRRFAEKFKEKYAKLDLLVLNAGIMAPPFSKTEDGFESQMAVNYFSHFLLTNLLFPILKKTKDSRIISLSSIAHRNGKIDFENINAEKSYSNWEAYSQSKLACLMFAYELQRRINSAGINAKSVAAHPGLSNTNLAQNSPWISKVLFGPISKIIGQDAKSGALPTLMAALEPSVKGGEYYGPDGFMEAKGNPIKVKSTGLSHNVSIAQKLWQESERLTGQEFIV